MMSGRDQGHDDHNKDTELMGEGEKETAAIRENPFLMEIRQREENEGVDEVESFIRYTSNNTSAELVSDAEIKGQGEDEPIFKYGSMGSTQTMVLHTNKFIRTSQ